ncbi:MAG: hypothetical protein IJD30_01920 [Clostridia bacterium]|nr:hypothetical protein [Clostridia bacterium]
MNEAREMLVNVGVYRSLTVEQGSDVMTNERLAEFIQQGGNDELIPILWERSVSRQDNFAIYFK